MGKYNVKIVYGQYGNRNGFIDTYNRLNDKTSGIEPFMEYSIDDTFDTKQFIEELKKIYEKRDNKDKRTIYAYVLDGNKLVYSVILSKVPAVEISSGKTKIIYNIKEYDEEEFQSTTNRLESLKILSMRSLEKEIKEEKTELTWLSVATGVLLLIPLLNIQTLIDCFRLDFGKLTMTSEEANITRFNGGIVTVLWSISTILLSVGIKGLRELLSWHKEDYEKFKSLKLTKE